jgi:hypothetical protein
VQRLLFLIALPLLAQAPAGCPNPKDAYGCRAYRQSLEYNQEAFNDPAKPGKVAPMPPDTMARDESLMSVDLLIEELRRMRRDNADTLDLSVNQVRTLLDDIEDRATRQYAEGVAHGRRNPVHSGVPR